MRAIVIGPVQGNPAQRGGYRFTMAAAILCSFFTDRAIRKWSQVVMLVFINQLFDRPRRNEHRLSASSDFNGLKIKAVSEIFTQKVLEFGCYLRGEGLCEPFFF